MSAREIVIPARRQGKSWLQMLLLNLRREDRAEPPDGLLETLIQAQIYERLMQLPAKQQGRVLRNVTGMALDRARFYEHETDFREGWGE